MITGLKHFRHYRQVLIKCMGLYKVLISPESDYHTNSELKTYLLSGLTDKWMRIQNGSRSSGNKKRGSRYDPQKSDAVLRPSCSSNYLAEDLRKVAD